MTITVMTMMHMRSIIPAFCEKTSGVCELLFVLIMPPSNVCPDFQVVVYTTEFAKPRARQKVQSTTAILRRGTSVLSSSIRLSKTAARFPAFLMRNSRIDPYKPKFVVSACSCMGSGSYSHVS